MSILVMCPSRGRPEKASDVWDTFQNTIASTATTLRFLVDDDDPRMNDYLEHVWDVKVLPAQGYMAGAVNLATKEFLDDKDITIFGFVGDDHRFRTKGWDTRLSDTLSTPGIAYAYDGVRDDLPTNWFVSRQIVDALGWMCLPACKHFYLDDAWRELGREAGVLRYIPEILIEHMHFTYGKSNMDETYQRSQNIWISGEDREPYLTWRNGEDFMSDLEKVRKALT